jgi:histidinol-phosphate aminotransferase
MNPNAHILHLSEYTPGKPVSEVAQELGLTHITKLASNENPWGCPVSYQELEKAVQQAMVYPNLNRPSLVTRLATHYQISTSQLILGNGSDDILQMLAIAFLSHDDHTITADYTFSVYRHVTQLLGATCITTEMTDFTYSIDALLQAITPTTKLIFIANPNNPTGTLLPVSEIQRLLATIASTISSDIIVVLDEAYRDFITEEDPLATVSLLKAYPNLIILRTFSKAYGLAGFRIGYAMGSESVISILQKVRQPFNVNSLALSAAELSLKNTAFLTKTITNNTQQRAWLTQKVEEMGVEMKLRVIPSHANFICIEVNRPAMDVYQGLLRKGYIIRPLDSFGLSGHIRVTIGTPEQNQGFLNAFGKVVIELDKEY